MKNLVTSLIRTYVPIIVGAVISYLSTKGLDIDAETAAGAIIALTGSLQALYYLIIRLIEKKFPQAGVLLGSAVKPVYTEKK